MESRNWRPSALGIFGMIAAGLVTGWTLRASDHSDAPQMNDLIRQDANLTDLHAYLVRRNLVITLASNPAIPPDVTDYVFPSDVTFEIHLDNHSRVSPDDPQHMGGTILDPDRIREDLTIRVRFRDNGRARVWILHHEKHPRPVPLVRFFAGLRDDPFIRGPRQGRNVAAMVLEVPLAAVTRRQSTLLIWATSKVDEFDGPFQDLIGRSLRSMMPENNAMNELPPSQQSRQMGVPPDVMIFDTAEPATYPNGRALTDDVVDLVDDPRVVANDAPFPSENDVPFLNRFPYLAPPHSPP